MSKKKTDPDFKYLLRELVDSIVGSDAAREIDAGCDGDGPLAHALVGLGDYKNLRQATKSIYGSTGES